jgi:glutaredoxin 3
MRNSTENTQPTPALRHAIDFNASKSVKILTFCSTYIFMPTITIYTTGFCPFCVQAKRLLKKKNIDFIEIPVGRDPQKRAEMELKSQRRTVPQIFNGDQHVGDCMELYELESKGKLDALLA